MAPSDGNGPYRSWIAQANGRVRDVNTAGWTMFGYASKEDFLVRRHGRTISRTEDWRRRIEAIRGGQHVFETQYQEEGWILVLGEVTAALEAMATTTCYSSMPMKTLRSNATIMKRWSGQRKRCNPRISA